MFLLNVTEPTRTALMKGQTFLSGLFLSLNISLRTLFFMASEDKVMETFSVKHQMASMIYVMLVYFGKKSHVILFKTETNHTNIN